MNNNYNMKNMNNKITNSNKINVAEIIKRVVPTDEYITNILNNETEIQKALALDEHKETIALEIIKQKNRVYNIKTNPLIDNYTQTITAEHVRNCKCCKEIVELYTYIEHEKYKNKLTKLTYTTTIEDKELTNNINKHEIIKLNNKAINETTKFINNIKYEIEGEDKNETIVICPYIYKELMKTIELFGKEYDMNSAKIQIIVKSILSYQMSLLTSQQYFNKYGIHEQIVDRQGNTITKITENEYYKLKLNEKIIQAVKTLDEIVEGSKTTITTNTQSVPITDIIKKLQDEFVVINKQRIIDSNIDEEEQ